MTSILAQPRADIWVDLSGPPQAELDATLRFGAELILKSDADSRLLVGAGSP
jgi:hypothetical protein